MVEYKKNPYTIVYTNLRRVFAIIDSGLGGAYLIGPQKNKKISIAARDEAHEHFTSCMNEMSECPSCLLYVMRDAENKMQGWTKRMLMNHMLAVLD